MGDGPAYDHAYAEAASRQRRKYQRHVERRDKLLKIMHTVGFGESDGDLTILEKDAAQHLERAYQLLSLFTVKVPE
jgi:hypothetical protein